MMAKEHGRENQREILSKHKRKQASLRNRWAVDRKAERVQEEVEGPGSALGPSCLLIIGVPKA